MILMMKIPVKNLSIDLFSQYLKGPGHFLFVCVQNKEKEKLQLVQSIKTIKAQLKVSISSQKFLLGCTGNFCWIYQKLLRGIPEMLKEQITLAKFCKLSLLRSSISLSTLSFKYMQRNLIRPVVYQKLLWRILEGLGRSPESVVEGTENFCRRFF